VTLAVALVALGLWTLWNYLPALVWAGHLRDCPLAAVPAGADAVAALAASSVRKSLTVITSMIAPWGPLGKKPRSPEREPDSSTSASPSSPPLSAPIGSPAQISLHSDTPDEQRVGQSGRGDLDPPRVAALPESAAGGAGGVALSRPAMVPMIEGEPEPRSIEVEGGRCIGGRAVRF